MIKQFLSLAILSMLSAPVFAGAGCCSGHGGVAQCGDDGYKYCVDGTRSPSCTCTATPEKAPTEKVTKEAAAAATSTPPVPAIALPPKPSATRIDPFVGPVPKDPSAANEKK